MSKRDELFDRFLEMRMEGKSFQAIAEQLGVSKQTLINWSKLGNVSDQVDVERMARIQASLQAFGQHQEAKVIAYASLSHKLQEELFKRDLAEVRRYKLLEALLKSDKRLEELAETWVFTDPEPFQTEWDLKQYYFDPKK